MTTDTATHEADGTITPAGTFRAIDIGTPERPSIWIVTEAFGPDALDCARSAAVMARCTGSIGATESRGGPDGSESTATVTRVTIL